MEGGKLIAKGSKSCVFIPNLPCRGSNRVNNDKISKVMYGKKAKKLIKQERRLNRRIISIRNSKKWAITFEEYCKPIELMELSKYVVDNINDIDMISIKKRAYDNVKNNYSISAAVADYSRIYSNIIKN